MLYNYFKYNCLIILPLFIFCSIAYPYSLINSNIDSTIKYYEKEAETLKNQKDKECFNIINYLGDLYKLKGDNYKALDILKKNEHDIIEKLGICNLTLAKCYDIIGEIYYYASDIEEAYKYWNNSLNIKLKLVGENNIHTAESYSLIGRYHNYKINKQKAYDYTFKAVKICRRLPVDSLLKINIAAIYREYAYAYKIKEIENRFEKGYDYKSILQLLDSALYYSNLVLGKGNYYNSQIYHDIGNIYNDNLLYYNKTGVKDYPTEKKHFVKLANKFYQKSLDIQYKYIGKKHDKISTTFFANGLLYLYAFGTDSITTCLTYYHKAIQSLILEYNNNDIYNLPPLQPALFNKSQLLSLLIFKADAFNRLYKQTNVLNDLKSAYEHYDLAVKYWDALINNYKTLEIYKILQTYNQLPFNMAITTANKLYELTADNKYKYRMFEISDRSKYSVLYRNLIEAKTKNTHDFTIKNIDIKTIQQKLLDEKTALIDYFYGKKEIFIFFITQEIVELIVVDDTNTLNKHIFSLRKSIIENDFSNYIASSYYLHKKLILPVTPLIKEKTNKLIIVPQGNISLIPFDALITDSILPKNKDYSKLNYLINKYQISYALSASILNYQPAQKSYNNQVSAFAPSFNTKSKLPFTYNNLQKLSKKVQGKFFFGSQATKENFLNNSTNYSIIHFGTHAIANTDNSLSSKIYFSDTAQDNYLTLLEMYDLHINSDLAILSACETGCGKLEQGEGIINFARGFAFAGVPSTLITLWKVDDQATNEIITTFYDYLIQGLPKAEALYKAKLNYLKNAKTPDDFNPFYWSGLILIGNNDTVKLETKGNFTYYIIGVACLLIIMTFVIIKKRKG